MLEFFFFFSAPFPLQSKCSATPTKKTKKHLRKQKSLKRSSRGSWGPLSYKHSMTNPFSQMTRPSHPRHNGWSPSQWLQSGVTAARLSDGAASVSVLCRVNQTGNVSVAAFAKKAWWGKLKLLWLLCVCVCLCVCEWPQKCYAAPSECVCGHKHFLRLVTCAHCKFVCVCVSLKAVCVSVWVHSHYLFMVIVHVSVWVHQS